MDGMHNGSAGPGSMNALSSPEPNLITFPAVHITTQLDARIEAELAAGHEGIHVVKVGGADASPGAVAEDLQRAGGVAIDVHPAHEPDIAFTICIL